MRIRIEFNEEKLENYGKAMAALSPYILTIYRSGRGYIELELSDDAYPLINDLNKLDGIKIIEL
ncbi:MAG: hypothetical protein JHC26_06755 [Thermofilum sp.]|jgi:hypothetical protein|uniref:hypothetical protein n=1 Tax=Thermofilum sp. TaxID=1961369 RepID=UPI00258B4399|nr:hypothetical protein [Thermofilum sp.]MCI4408774.1 hypothetical protein [Thermofilum sp.]